MTFIEIVKDIAAVIGLVISAVSLITLCSDKAKKAIAGLFSRYNQEQDKDIKEMKEAIQGLSNKIDTLMQHDEIVLEFTKQQCRNIIKEMFYKYYDTKVLPLYERKTLIYVEDIYITKLNGNSYASELISEMKNWEIDYKSSHIEEE